MYNLTNRRSQQDVRSLVIDAIVAALDDAGVDASEVDGIVTEIEERRL